MICAVKIPLEAFLADVIIINLASKGWECQINSSFKSYPLAEDYASCMDGIGGKLC